MQISTRSLNDHSMIKKIKKYYIKIELLIIHLLGAHVLVAITFDNVDNIQLESLILKNKIIILKFMIFE